MDSRELNPLTRGKVCYNPRIKEYFEPYAMHNSHNSIEEFGLTFKILDRGRMPHNCACIEKEFVLGLGFEFEKKI